MDEFSKLFVQNTKFPLWIRRLEDGIFVYVNEAFADLYKKDIKDIVDHKFTEVILPEMFEKFSILEGVIIESGKCASADILTPSGTRRCKLIPLKNDDGKVNYIAGLFDEEEETVKKTKLLIEGIMNTLPGIIFFKDINGKYVYANKMCQQVHMKRYKENIIGKTDSELSFTKKQKEKFIRDDNLIVKTKKGLRNEAIFSQENGKNIYREVEKAPLIDDNGEVVGIVGRALDVTERVLANQRMEFLSYTDVLTGARNRASFEERARKYSDLQYLPLGLIMGDANGLKIVNDTLGHLEGDKLLKDVVEIMKEVCKDKGDVFRFGGDEFVVLLPNTTLKECESLVSEITSKCDECKKEKFNISIALGSAVKKDMETDIYEVLKEAEDRVYRKKLTQKKSVKNSILTSLKEGLNAKSGETESHTTRVAERAVKVGKMMNLEMSQLDELKIAADLHDIGKIGISEDILLKKGKLTDEEYKIMKTHSEKGYRIINATSELKSIAEAVLYHHERWDGTGYPMGLKGEDISIISRIISVCDAFDVMVNDRIYKKAISKEDAIAEVKRCSGTQFDPKVVEAFLKCFDN